MILDTWDMVNKINVVCDPLLESTSHEGRQALSRNDRCGESYKGKFSYGDEDKEI